MKCPRHPKNEATGYCTVCGDLGCEECLHDHEGQRLCPRHYRPIARKLEEEKRHEDVRKRHPRQRMVVRYADGRCEYGVCFALSVKDTGFHLDLVDQNETPLAETKHVRFEDLKAVFLVKSFDGKFDKTASYKEWNPEGGELVVQFNDGEVVRGFSLRRYDPDELRFHLIPLDPTTNNVSILVERTAVAAVYTPDEYKAKRAQEKEAKKSTGPAADLSQEEGTGDFYFETRNYEAALEQYRLAQEKHPDLRRLKKKLLLAQYNVGIQHIKRHEYDKALALMETVLAADPHNSRVRRKVSKLRHIIKRKSDEARQS